MLKIYFVLVTAMSLVTFTAGAQVYPYIETFDSYPASGPLNGNGGIVATSHVQLYGGRGLNGTNCAEFQMAALASSHYDTLTGPLVGPLTANTTLSFYFRVVTYTGSTPQAYHMGATDDVQIWLVDSNSSTAQFIYNIYSNNQNSFGSYIRGGSTPSVYIGQSVRFRVIALNPAANDWIFELDSVVIKDASTASSMTLSDVVTNAKCNGLSNGSISVAASGGTPPYSYHWNTGGTLDSIDARPAGGYSVTVTDHAGATAVLSDSIHQPTALTASTATTPASGMNGTATVTAAGGSPPYTYIWNTSPAQTTPTATGMASGSYQVTATDQNGCTVIATATIQPSGISDVNEAAVALHPNPASDRAYVALSSGKTDISIYDTSGKLVSQQQMTENSFDVSALSNGSYIARIISGVHRYSTRFTINR